LKTASTSNRFVNHFVTPTPTQPARQPVLPDLVVHEAALLTSLNNAKVEKVDGKAQLRYAFAVGNRGPGHLVLIGKRADPTAPTIAARQLAYEGQTPVVVREGGSFSIEEDAHNHWHYQNTAILKLEKEGLDGWEYQTHKSHFAMVDSGSLDNPMPRDPSIPETARGNFTFEGERYPFGTSARTAMRVAQTITSGKYDFYGTYLNNPIQLPTDAIDGTYTLTVQVDPNDVIAETDETNNTVRYRVVVEDESVVELTKL
jgi:hypothetical protein